MSEVSKNKTTIPDKARHISQQRSRAMNPFEEMDRLFENFFPRDWVQPVRQSWSEIAAPFDGKVPRIDVLEKDDAIVIRAELPGVSKDNVDISLTEDSATITANTHQEQDEEKGNYYHREITRGSFSRTVSLPIAVQSDQAKATFKDGMLELNLPKAAPAKRHSIKVE